MDFAVVELTDAATARERADALLTARPVELNLLLSILDFSIEHALAGTFWLVVAGSETVGFALESPPGRGAVFSPMPPEAARLLAERITRPLPSAAGEAGAVAAFAGHWTECRRTAVTAVDPQRMYALTDLQPVASVPGTLRPARAEDRETLIEWTTAFVDELDLHPEDAVAIVDARIATGQFWIWDDDGPATMTSVSPPVCGVTRIQYVYTPPARRGAGYATVCVGTVSQMLVERGLQCVLFTDLGNATSNAIYRRIGYTAVMEILGYDFA